MIRGLYGNKSMCGLTMSDKRDQDNVLPFQTPQRSNGGGNGGSDIRERLAILEERSRHFATKTDIRDLKIWVLGGIIGAVPVLVALFLWLAKYLAN